MQELYRIIESLISRVLVIVDLTSLKLRCILKPLINGLPIKVLIKLVYVHVTLFLLPPLYLHLFVLLYVIFLLMLLLSLLKEILNHFKIEPLLPRCLLLPLHLDLLQTILH